MSTEKPADQKTALVEQMIVEDDEIVNTIRTAAPGEPESIENFKSWLDEL